MMGRLLRSLVVVLALVSPVAVCAEKSYGELLHAADAIRSTNVERFGELLLQLEHRAKEATPAERDYFRLLRDYRQAIAGDSQGASGDAMVLLEQTPDAFVQYRAALLVSNVAAINRDYIVGLRYLDRALQLRDRMPDPATRSLSGVVAGTLYTEFGHHELALTEADRLLADRPDARTRCIARQIRARALNGLDRPLDESADIHEAIADCAGQGEKIAVNAIRCTLAEYWAAHGRRQQAIALLEASLPEANGTGYPRLIGEMRRLLAQYQLDEGHLAAAEQHARVIVSGKGQDPMSLATVVAHHVLYAAALARNDTARALDEYRRYAEADKARLNDIKAREYAFQLSQHELKQKNQSIELLQSQNQLLMLQQQAARASAWNTRLAIALLLVLVVSLGYWVWRARRTHGSLRALAETDGLTGLANRRHFRARSEAALALCAQRKRPACVLLFDLDHFKQINDQCGHSAGDWVLREVARVGRLHCREQDIFGRIGGEEFAMTLIDCDAEAAMRTAEACRRAIEAIDASNAGCAQPVAASIGVVSTSLSGYDYEALIAHADAAMYRSKVAGRNRVTLYERPPVPQPGSAPVMDRRNAEAMLKQY